MSDSEGSAATEKRTAPVVGDDLPPGEHPLEVAARRGIGPLSRMAHEVWHGHSVPCVSCGQLVLRDQTECDYCGQDLSLEMIEKMRARAGPWYVLEHLRPFPGVNLDLIVRQIRRGVLTETSIVRGPSTDFQWRFAVETPGLCRYFGRCWKCHAEVSPSDGTCPNCHTYLSFEPPRPKSAAAKPARSPQLSELSAALNQAEVSVPEPNWDEPPRIGRISATWIAAALILIVIAALMWMVHLRSQGPSSTTPAVPGLVLPFSEDPRH